MDEKIDLLKANLVNTNVTPEEFAKRYKAYKKAEAKFKEIYEPFKQSFLDLYNTTPALSNGVVIDGVKITYVSSSIRNSIDTKKLKEEEPELVKKYMKATTVDATIRLDY